MSKPDPIVDQRRAEAIFAELLARAQSWIPDWQLARTEQFTVKEPDFGFALLRIAARLSSEVTERLDRTPAKAVLGLLDWLGITRLSGHAARMPVVFKMANGVVDTVLAPKRVRIQANVGDAPIAFETQQEVQLVPAPIRQMVGVDPDADAIYFPPMDVLSLEAPTSGPTEWTVKSLASSKSTKLQLTPPLGLQKDTILQVAGLEYQLVAEPQGDIVTVEPSIGFVEPGVAKMPVGANADIQEGKTVKKVRNFIPFGGTSRNLQEHALYIGDEQALKLTSPQRIIIEAEPSLPDDLTWEYLGKLGEKDPQWNPLKSLRTQKGDLLLEFDQKEKNQAVSIENYEVEGRSSYWIRARRTTGNSHSVTFSALRLKINCSVQKKDCSRPTDCCPEFDDIVSEQMPKMEGVAQNISLVMNERFYPLGKIPRQLDSFYLACAEVFSKPGAEACIRFNLAEATLDTLAIVETKSWYRDNGVGWPGSGWHVYGVGGDGFLYRYLLYVDNSSKKPVLKYIGLTRPSDERFMAADNTKPPVIIVDQLNNIRVVVWSDDRAWIWDQKATEQDADKNWKDFALIGNSENPIKIKQIVLIGSMTLAAVAIDGSLWFRPVDPSGSWNPIVPLWFGLGEINENDFLITKLQSSTNLLSKFIWEKFEPTTKQSLQDPNSTRRESVLVEALNAKILPIAIYTPDRFANVELRPETELLLRIPNPAGNQLIRLNRLLLQDAFPEISKDRQWDRIVPVMAQSMTTNPKKYVLTESLPNVFFMTDDINKMARFVYQDNLWANVETRELRSIKWDSDFTPIAILSENNLLIASRNSNNKALWGNHWKNIDNDTLIGKAALPEGNSLDNLPTEEILGSGFAGVTNDSQLNDPAFKTLYLLFTLRRSEGDVLAWWTPLDADSRVDYDATPPSSTIGTLAKSPAVANSFVLVPGDTRDVLMGNFVPLQRKLLEIKEQDLVSSIKTAATFSDGDFLEVPSGSIISKFEGREHQTIKLNNANIYAFSKNEKLEGNRGIRYPDHPLTGRASWLNTDPKKLTLAINQNNINIKQGCIFILDYTSTSDEKSIRICTVNKFTEEKVDEDGTRHPATVILDEDLTDYKLPNGKFDFYVYVKPENPEKTDGYSAEWDESSKKTLILRSAPNLTEGSVLVLEYQEAEAHKYSVHTVKTAPTQKAPPTIEVDQELPENLPVSKPITYYVYNLYLGDEAHYYGIPFAIKPAIFWQNPNDDIKTSVKLKPVLHFLDTRAKPKQQKVEEVFEEIISDRGKFLAILEKPWQIPPLPPTQSDGRHYFSIDTVQSDWARFTADVDTKPDLSWEYWNGSGWWKIEKVDDSTEDLKQTGALWFEVPSDIQQTEILGRQSWWIRGRLIGGDYGREAFDVTTSTDETKKTQTQSVVVNTNNVHAPLALGIRIAYNLCTPISPKYLLTFDSKSWLDKSDANRTGGAVVDAFVPVAERLRQLSDPSGANVGTGKKEATPCECDSPFNGQTRTLPDALANRPAASFSPGKKPDETSLKILSISPVRNATEVAIDATIRVVFSEPLDPASVSASTFQLRNAAEVSVPATITYDGDNNTAILTPNATLAQSKTYTVTLSGGGDTGIMAASGKLLAADFIWTITTAASSSRAIYLAFDKQIKGSPIRILFLLEDLDHDKAMPLIVEALRNNRFEPVIAQDDTRALGESGLLTLMLDEPPSQVELFGITGYWLRLRPATSAAAAQWQPHIRGAYVNAVWAYAAETQEKEILGSSDGSPSQQVVLTRSPVLRDSLQLRIREPLGDEELQQLMQIQDAVKNNEPDLPDSWVLWKEVPDPGNAGPNDRVYALDPASGEIRFGDGIHGAIPPIGRDAIVAFEYRHGGEAAANRVPPFAQLSLVSPIAGVEAAFTPDRAAGGSDAEDIVMVKRFAAARLRHRERAVTLRDLEDLALHLSSDIAQARAFAEAGTIRLVIVLGSRDPNRLFVDRPDPDPSRAFSRELRRNLLDYASPLFAKQGALAVVKADRVRFRIDLNLQVASLDVTGSVSEAVKKAVQLLFDPASGGYDGLGWRIGDSPSNDGVASRLLSIQDIDTIDSILFSRSDIQASKTEYLPLKPDQFAWLETDGVSVQFSTRAVLS
jgi:hypothetical protein